MGITWDLLGRLLLSLPFSLILVGCGLYVLIEAWEARRAWKKIALALAALVVMAVGVGITVMIVSDNDFVWCTRAHRDDPGCKLRGGE
jgi:cytochrome c oxidase subunit IV